MKQDTHVKGHFRTLKNGKVVYVQDHHAQHEHAVHPDVDTEFAHLFPDSPQAPAPAAEAQAQAEGAASDVDAEFQHLFGDTAEAPQAAAATPADVEQEFDALFGDTAAPADDAASDDGTSVTSLTAAGVPVGAKVHYPKGAFVEKLADGLAYAGPFNWKVRKAIKEAFPKVAKWDKAMGAWKVPADGAAQLDIILTEHLGQPLYASMPSAAEPAAAEPPAAEPVAPAPAAKAPREAPQPAPGWDGIEPGMAFKNKAGTTGFVIVDTDSSPIVVQFESGLLSTMSYEDYQSIQKDLVLTSTTGDDFHPALEAGAKVGDTKVIFGTTYQLNANHRWEKVGDAAPAPSEALAAIQALQPYNYTYINGFLVKKTHGGFLIISKKDPQGKPWPAKVKAALAELHPAGYKKKQQFYIVDPSQQAEAAAIMENPAALKNNPKTTPSAAVSTPAPLPPSFPYTQVGPQKGSNPGGLYEDAYGKKWYIKFPASEDHAKNELLAAKLYKMAGVAAPRLKLVTKDGKVGIASAYVDGLTQGSGAALAKAPGARAGFGADAWLANWDSVGLNNDNLLLGPDGNAVRIDVGGSLLYRAQGGPKGAAFGDSVTEADSLRDPKTNPKTAAVFGGMSPQELRDSVVRVLAIPDDAIKAAVDKFGPGDQAEKDALVAKLIARRQDLAKRFPDAEALANPPKPDPTKLAVDASKLPTLPTFANWNGTGKPLSSSEAVNAANQTAVQAIYDAALQGNLVAVKGLKLAVVDKASGAVTMKPAFEHPSQHVRAFYDQVVEYMDVIANPAASKAKQWDLEDAEDIQGLSEAFKPHFYGTSVATIPANERLGFWMSLGTAADPHQFMPPKVKNVDPAQKAKGKLDYQKMPAILKSWLGSVQSSGGNNQPYRDGAETDYQGRNTRDVLQAAYAHATEFDEGTTIRKWIGLPTAMSKQLDQVAEGHVFQNPGSMCCSMSDKWESGAGSGFGSNLLTIHYAKGAKGLATYGSGSFAGEQEITTLPGQRFMILKKEKLKSGAHHITLLMLPPDPTYVDNIKPAQKVA